MLCSSSNKVRNKEQVLNKQGTRDRNQMETSVLRPRGRTPHRTMTLWGVRSSVESPGFPTPCPWDLARPATAPTYRWGRLEGARPHPGTECQVSSASQKSLSCSFPLNTHPCRPSLRAGRPRQRFMITDPFNPRDDPGRHLRPGGRRGSLRRRLLSPSGTECSASRRMALSLPDTRPARRGGA